MNTSSAHPAIASLVSILLLSGCSVTGSIKPAATSSSGFEGAVYSGETTVINAPTPGVESFRIFNQGATGFVSSEGNHEDAKNRANEFCTQRGKSSRILQTTLSKPPHIFGNYPRAEILFECVDGQISNAEPTPTDKYSKLAALKRLLDSGALNQAEYDSEKAKLLAK